MTFFSFGVDKLATLLVFLSRKEKELARRQSKMLSAGLLKA
jgi:hypothetical protein